MPNWEQARRIALPLLAIVAMRLSCTWLRQLYKLIINSSIVCHGCHHIPSDSLWSACRCLNSIFRSTTSCSNLNCSHTISSLFLAQYSSDTPSHPCLQTSSRLSLVSWITSSSPISDRGSTRFVQRSWFTTLLSLQTLAPEKPSSLHFLFLTALWTL